MQEVSETKERVPSATPSEKTPTLCSPSGSLFPSGKTPWSYSTSRSLPKKVLLHDWWLIKTVTSHGSKKLGVGGMAWTGQKARRVFHSSAIVKRHDSWNLETADGIMVTIHGLINRSNTHQNGYPVEVCCIFLTGFPFDWDTYANDHVVEDIAGRSPTKVSSFEALWKTPTTKYVQDFSGHALRNCEDKKDQNLTFIHPSMKEEGTVRSETNLSCLEGSKPFKGDTGNCSSNTFTEIERNDSIEVKSEEGVHPECHSECRYEGREVNPSPGELICKESKKSKSWNLRSRKAECIKSFCEDGMEGLKRSRRAGTRGIDHKSEPGNNGKNVIAIEGDVRSETNLSCKDGSKLVTGDTGNCSSNTFTEIERKSFIEVKSEEGVGPEYYNESRNEGRKVNPSLGTVICKESQRSKSWKKRSRKAECVKSLCEDGTEVLERRSAGESGINHKSEPGDNGNNVIALEGEKDDCRVGATTRQTRRSSSKFHKAKINLTTTASLQRVKSEIITAAPSPNMHSPLQHSRVVEVKQETVDTRVGKKKNMKSECISEVLGTPTSSGDKLSSFSPTESLNWRRSRSGRLLAPMQAVWRNQRLVYEQDGRIIGVETRHTASPSGTGSASSRRKQKCCN